MTAATILPIGLMAYVVKFTVIGFACAAGLFKRGVLVAGTYSKARTIRIEPALGIPMTLLQEMLNRLEDTFKEVARQA